MALKETLRKLMDLCMDEKTDGTVTDIKIGNTACSVWILDKDPIGTYHVSRHFSRHKTMSEDVWLEGCTEVSEGEVIRALEAVRDV